MRPRCDTDSGTGPRRVAGNAAWVALWLVVGLLALPALGCGRSSPPSSRIPDGTVPCQSPEVWPLSQASPSGHFLVHYATAEEATVAGEVITTLDKAWGLEVDQMGFTAPPPDLGACGPDSAFDVFIWRGHRSCFVDVISEQIFTPWGGRADFMILDPWGPYGGNILAQTVGHEFNHACHAADDWHETGIAFEMTATYIEENFGDACGDCVSGFQANPDWSLLWFDDYKTWYMYGSALYLHFLRDRYFPDDERFAARIWRNCRNDPDPYVNRPDFIAAVDKVLAPVGSSFLESAVLFARWRYYAGKNDDGRHFVKRQASFKELPFLQPEANLRTPEVLTLDDADHDLALPPMILGSTYVEVNRANSGQSAFLLTLSPNLPVPGGPQLRWVAQAIPGSAQGSDGDLLDLSSGAARVAFGPNGKRILVFTLMPVGAFDADHQSGESYPLKVHLSLAAGSVVKVPDSGVSGWEASAWQPGGAPALWPIFRLGHFPLF